VCAVNQSDNADWLYKDLRVFPFLFNWIGKHPFEVTFIHVALTDTL